MYKVLIADDEPLILEGLADLINWEEHGLQIAGLVSNGLDAKNIVDSSDINILITDIRMPRMDGIELIKYIAQTEKNIKFIILSGYNDFEYVKEAAKIGIENYLLKPVDEKELISTLINTVDKIENEIYKKKELQQGYNILRDNILFRLVSGDISGQELKEKVNFLNINLKQVQYICSIIKISSKDLTGPSSRDRSVLRFDMQNICSRIIEDRGLGIPFLDMGGDIVILFSGNHLEERITEIRQTLWECIEKINTLLKIDIFITVGNLEKDYHFVCKSYRQAKTIQDNYLILGYNHVLFYEEAIESSQPTFIDMKDDLVLLNDALKSRNISTVYTVIEDIFSQLNHAGKPNPAALHSIATTILFQIFNTIRLLNYNTNMVFDDLKDLFSNVNKFESLEDMVNWLKEITLTCMDILDTEDKKRSPLIRKVISYLNSNYSMDINLKTVASDFDLNAFYLGHLFKKEIGEPFTNYLNKLRIKRAIELIKDGRLKNNELAKKVGYINTNYFFTVFKKITGMSPTEYKEVELHSKLKK
jgi:two-component system, response regulator YesN